MIISILIVFTLLTDRWTYTLPNAVWQDASVDPDVFMCPPHFYSDLNDVEPTTITTEDTTPFSSQSASSSSSSSDSVDRLKSRTLPHRPVLREPSHMSSHTREGEKKPHAKICQYCPHISCFIVRGTRQDISGNNVMSCRRKNNLPHADEVVLYLDCIMTGPDRDHVNLFIYYPKPSSKNITVDCIEKNFLDWLKDDRLNVASLELGFKMQDLSFPSLLIQHKENLKNLKFLVITPHSDIEKLSLSREEGTMTNTTIIFKHQVTGEHAPSIKGLVDCFIRPKQILFMTECYFNTTSPNFEVLNKAQLGQFSKKSEYCTYRHPTQAPEYERGDILLDQLPVHFEAVAGIVLVTILSLVIGVFIAFYYIRNHSRFSAKKRQQRLEKKRAIDAYIKQSYLAQNKASSPTI